MKERGVNGATRFWLEQLDMCRCHLKRWRRPSIRWRWRQDEDLCSGNFEFEKISRKKEILESRAQKRILV